MREKRLVYYTNILFLMLFKLVQKKKLTSHLTENDILLIQCFSDCFPCYKCGNTYRQYRNLYTHLKECGKEPSLGCTYCSYKCRRHNQLRLHIFNKHGLESTFPKHTIIYAKRNK